FFDSANTSVKDNSVNHKDITRRSRNPMGVCSTRKSCSKTRNNIFVTQRHKGPCALWSRFPDYFFAFPFARGGTFSSTHFRMTSATWRLLVPSIIMCVEPLKIGLPSSSSLTYSALALPCPWPRLALIWSTVVWHCWLVAV